MPPPLGHNYLHPRMRVAPMSSKSLEYKIRGAKHNAPHELPTARLCAAVVHALVSAQSLDAPLRALKSHKGTNWSPLLALQYMSGRRAEMAAEASPPGERVGLYLAHLVAKQACSAGGFGAVGSVHSVELARLQKMAEAAAAGATTDVAKPTDA